MAATQLRLSPWEAKLLVSYYTLARSICQKRSKDGRCDRRALAHISKYADRSITAALQRRASPERTPPL